MTSLESTPAVVGVAVIGPHIMRLLFSDGMVRDIRFRPGARPGALLRPLDDPAYFALVRVDPDCRTVVWPNGLDLAPEVLHGDFPPNDSLGFEDVTARQPV